MAKLDLKNCVVILKDGSGTPKTVTIKIGEGNVTWTESKNREYVLDRGKLDSVRDGDEVPVDFKAQFTWEFLKADGGTVPTIEEALKQSGVASDWVSSDSDTCAPYAVDIQITYDPLCASVKKEVYLFSDFRYETLEHDMKGGMVSFSGKCNTTAPTITRVTNTN